MENDEHAIWQGHRAEPYGTAIWDQDQDRNWDRDRDRGRQHEVHNTDNTKFTKVLRYLFFRRSAMMKLMYNND